MIFILEEPLRTYMMKKGANRILLYHHQGSVWSGSFVEVSARLLLPNENISSYLRQDVDEYQIYYEKDIEFKQDKVTLSLTKLLSLYKIHVEGVKVKLLR